LCWGGQFVTEELRSWAKQAVQQERALKTQRVESATKTLAVLYFHNKTGWPKLDLLQKGLSLMLITDLSKVKEIRLLERGRIQALVEELGLGVSGLVAADTAPRVGRLLGANLVVGGDIAKEESNVFQLKSGLLNVPVEKMLGSPAVRGRLLVELFRMEKDLVFQIIRLLKIELSWELKEELKDPLAKNIEALLYLFEAIENADRGNHEDAKELIRKALEEDPDFDMADGARDEIAGFFPGNGGNTGGDSGEAGTVQKKCAAQRNKLLRQSFKRRRW
jgi:TolB-like protein